MSEEKQKSPEVKALETQVEDLNEKIEKMSALQELLDGEKELRKQSEEKLELAELKLDSIKTMAKEYDRFSDSKYEGRFISEELTKVLNKEKKIGKDKTS